MNKKLQFWPWVLAWALLALLSCYIRLWPLRAHLWDDARDQATLMVVYNIKQTLLKEILTQAPTMPPALASHLADEKLNETMHTQNQKVQEAIDRVTASLANQPGAAPEKIYLLESDPYDFYNLTENIVKTGRMAKIIKGSKYFNPLMCAPFGAWQPFTLHPYWGFVIYKFLQLFNPNISLMAAVAYTPLFTYLFIIAACLWVCSVLNLSVVASFVGTLFLIMAPINLKRGALGWYRTDPYNILFPLLLLGCLFLSLRPSSKKDGYLWSIIFGLTAGVYALFWQGWGFSFGLGVISALAAALYNFFIKKDKAHSLQNLSFIGWTVAASLLVIGLCFSFKDFFILFKEGFGELVKFTQHGLDLWPNLYLTVGEIEKTSLMDIITSVGGPIFMLLGFGGWIYKLRMGLKNYRRPEVIDTIILSVFLMVTMALSFYGARFVLFVTIPLSILSACAMDRFIGLKTIGFPLFDRAFAKLTWFPKSIGLFLAALLIALTLFNANRDIRTVLTPIFNSTWDDALTKIKNETPPNSIINTWWCPGHFIKGIAHRRVAFDGASLSLGPIGYWMANVFLSQDEAQAQGILRMINTSGNKAAEYLVHCGLKLSDAVSLLLAIAPEDKQAAASTLKGIITDDQIKKLLTMTHDGHPSSYLLVYNELVDDNLMLAFTGRWNFKKIEEINSNPDELKSVPTGNLRDFANFLFSIMGGRPKYSDALPLLGQKGTELVFGENLIIDLSTMDAQIQSSTYGQGNPYSVFYLKDNQIVEHLNPEGNLNYSVVLYKEDGQYVVRLMDHDLANSLIMKLYYFNGAGLKYFKPVITSHDLTGRTRIKVFKVIY